MVVRVFLAWSGQFKDRQTGVYCFSVKHSALRSNSRAW